MKIKVPTDLWVRQPGAEKEERTGEGTAGDDDAFGLDDDGTRDPIRAADASVAVPGSPPTLHPGCDFLSLDVVEKYFVCGKPLDELRPRARGIR